MVSKSGRKVNLSNGMTVEARITYDEVTYFNYVLEKLGFTSQAVRVDGEGFLSDYTLPAIANILTKEGLSHFVVIFKISFIRAMLLLKSNSGFAKGKIRGNNFIAKSSGEVKILDKAG